MFWFDVAERALKQMKWYDIALIKLSTAAFMLMLAKLWSPILSLSWHWYLIILVVAALRPIAIMFGSK